MSAGLPKGRGVYVIEAVMPDAGIDQGEVLTRGRRGPLAVQVKATADAPTPGQAASRAPSPNLAAPLGVNPICARQPACPLHAVSLSDVVGSGRPVAVLFATPALCQTRYCGPVLAEFLTASKPFTNQMAFVHVEIYQVSRG